MNPFYPAISAEEELIPINPSKSVQIEDNTMAASTSRPTSFIVIKWILTGILVGLINFQVYQLKKVPTIFSGKGQELNPAVPLFLAILVGSLIVILAQSILGLYAVVKEAYFLSLFMAIIFWVESVLAFGYIWVAARFSLDGAAVFLITLLGISSVYTTYVCILKKITK